METRYGLAIETLSSNLSGGTSRFSKIGIMPLSTKQENLGVRVSQPTPGSVAQR